MRGLDIEAGLGQYLLGHWNPLYINIWTLLVNLSYLLYIILIWHTNIYRTIFNLSYLFFLDPNQVHNFFFFFLFTWSSAKTHILMVRNFTCMWKFKGPLYFYRISLWKGENVMELSNSISYTNSISWILVMILSWGEVWSLWMNLQYE